MVCVDRLPLLSEIYRDENQTFSSVNSAWIHSIVLITLPCYWHLLYIVFHKRDTPYKWWCLCQIFTDFHNSFTGRFYSKFAVKRLLKIAQRLAYVATLPCERLMSEEQSINGKLQCSVATYFQVWWSRINKVYCCICLWIFFKKSVNIWQCHLREWRWSSRASSHHTAKSRNYSIFAKRWLILIFFTGRLSNKPFLIWLFKIPPQLKYVTTVPSNLFLITALVCDWHLLTLIFHKVV